MALIKKKNKSLSRKEKGSKDRRKAKKSLARQHRTIANKRLDNHFKLVLKIVRIYDYGFSDFLKILENKAKEHKKIFHKINRFFSSSKMCSKCGNVKNKEELKLKDRIFKCLCGHIMDRDLNAAINILREGGGCLP